MDMRNLPGDPAEASLFDWDRFLAEVGTEASGEGDCGELLVLEAKSHHREPRSWWKAPRLGLWRFPPT